MELYIERDHHGNSSRQRAVAIEFVSNFDPSKLMQLCMFRRSEFQTIRDTGCMYERRISHVTPSLIRDKMPSTDMSISIDISLSCLFIC